MQTFGEIGGVGEGDSVAAEDIHCHGGRCACPDAVGGGYGDGVLGGGGEGVGEDGTGFGNRGAVDSPGKALGKAAGGNEGGFVAGAYFSGAVDGYVGCSKGLDTQLVDIKVVIIVGIIVDANVFGAIWQSDGDLTGR